MNCKSCEKPLADERAVFVFNTGAKWCEDCTKIYYAQPLTIVRDYERMEP